jgi:hypothetical protein
MHKEERGQLCSQCFTWQEMVITQTIYIPVEDITIPDGRVSRFGWLQLMQTLDDERCDLGRAQLHARV